MPRKNKIVGKMGLGNHGLASTDNIRVSTIQVLASIWAAAPHRHSLSSLGRLSKLLIWLIWASKRACRFCCCDSMCPRSSFPWTCSWLWTDASWWDWRFAVSITFVSNVVCFCINVCIWLSNHWMRSKVSSASMLTTGAGRLFSTSSRIWVLLQPLRREERSLPRGPWSTTGSTASTSSSRSLGAAQGNGGIGCYGLRWQTWHIPGRLVHWGNHITRACLHQCGTGILGCLDQPHWSLVVNGWQRL